MSEFDKLLELITDENDRKKFATNTEMRARVEKNDDFVRRWETWRVNEWDNEAKMTKKAAAALRMKDQEIEALKALTVTNPGDGSFDDIEKGIATYLQKHGYVNRQQLEQDILSKAGYAKPDDVKVAIDKIQNLESGAELALGNSTQWATEYYREFDKLPELPKWKNANVYKFMRENNIVDFDKAYDQYVAPLRAKVVEERAKEREAQIRKEVREETLKEVTMKQGALPVDERGGSPEQMGTLKAWKARKANPDSANATLTPGELGTYAAANDMLKAYTQDLANGTKPTPVQ